MGHHLKKNYLYLTGPPLPGFRGSHEKKISPYDLPHGWGVMEKERKICSYLLPASAGHRPLVGRDVLPVREPRA